MSKYYAVKVGKQPGIFTTWPEAQQKIIRFRGAIYKSFKTSQEAEQFMDTNTPPDDQTNDNNNQKMKQYDLVVYTDGSCKDNIGGYAFVILNPSADTNESLLNNKI